jgi:hypothetical protein
VNKYPVINYVYCEDVTCFGIEDRFEPVVKNNLVSFVLKFALKHKWIKKVIEKNKYVKVFNVDETAIIDAIKGLYYEIYNYSGERPVAVMVGRKQAMLLQHECFQYASFQMDAHIHDGHIAKVIGLDVIINPFIDGVVLLNKDMLR